MITIPNLLSADDIAAVRKILDGAAWQDGRATAGFQAVQVKRNLQLALDDPIAAQLGQLMRERLAQAPLFIAAALPRQILPPRFNRYEGGGTYGDHVDNALLRLGEDYIRTDLSCTIFLNDPAEYEGGELIIASHSVDHQVKLAAGDMILYPSTSLHRVQPVTKGVRLASFFWVQSLVRSQEQRDILLTLDQSIQDVTRSAPDHPSIARLTGVYHNLLRLWSDT
jgi:PKHD-type hydroxylase